MHRMTSLAACAGMVATLSLALPLPVSAQTTSDPASATAREAAPSSQASSEWQPPASAQPAPAESAAPPPAPAPVTATPAPPPAPPATPFLDEVRQFAAKASSRGNATTEDRNAVRDYYAKDGNKLLWVSQSGFTARARHAMAEIAKADDWGLQASAFELPQLGADTSAAALADAEVKLSLAALRYARFARGGRLEPLKVSRNFDQKPTIADPDDVMVALAATEAPGDYLRDLHPKHQQFHLLRQALLKSRGAGQTAQAPKDPAADVKIPNGPLLKPGMDHPHVALLRKRLKVASSGPDTVYDRDLQDAVAAFQKQNSQKADGVVGKGTRAMLNGDDTPAPTYGSDEQRLIVNMERWRWMPPHMGEFHVWDNIPEFHMRVVKRGQIVHQGRIIVGRAQTQSALFSANMRYVIFGPEWGVPDSIKVKEILPYLRPSYEPGLFGFGGGTSTDTRVLAKHNLRVSYNGQPVDASRVDWTQVDIRKYAFIQPSGPTNVLGAVKFRFPNKHDIYMHDTPQRELFSKSVRTFSHGCIRVQDPGRLAEVLLEEDRGWPAARVQKMMAAGGNENVTLAKEIPVHITYFTTIVESDGQLRSHADVYGHDRRVALALAGRPLGLEPPSAGSDDGPIERVKTKRPKSYAPSASNDFFSGLFGN
jgi:murein L,D-transpeptidase YcbB/YkuD